MKHKVSIAKNILLTRIIRRPFKVNFIVTNRCNSRCLTCFCWRNSVNDQNLEEKELKLEDFRKIFRNLPNTVSWISFSGGEPFIRKDLADIILSSVELVPTLKLISIPTNGFETENIMGTVSKLKDAAGKRFPNIFLTFSLDGPEEVHDRIRGIKGAFQKTYANYIKVKKMLKHNNSFEVGIETTISKFNVGKIRDFAKQRISRGDKLVMTIAHNAFLYHNQEFSSMAPDNLRELEEIIKLVKSNQRWYKIDELVAKMYLSRLPSFVKNPKQKVMSCVALKNSVSIDCQGNVIPCFMWGHKLGNLKEHDYDLIKIWKSERASEAKKLIKQDKCPNCWTPCQAYLSLFWGVG